MNKCAVCKNKSVDCYKNCHFEDSRSPADLAEYDRLLINFAQTARNYAKKYDEMMLKSIGRKSYDD